MARVEHVYMNMVKGDKNLGENDFFIGEVHRTARSAQIAKQAYEQKYGYVIETCLFIGPIEESRRETKTF